ncbi:hypothetical protein [Bacteroides oleiciplenus]|uniref:hypothetical protein n=1 Tax=Bacteroides oleiciplenus TaxID=626931 RepID=UPI0026DB97D7|nr:hypothetical protein [Bacteroides oleiciplenus]
MNKRKELIMCFPLNLKEDVQVVIDKLIINDEDIHGQTYNVKVDNMLLTIPERIYFDEPASENLTTIQKYILDCIFTRHHNGFIRQKHLRNLLFCTEYWIMPFCFKLLGEYVKDILFDIKVQIENNIDNYLYFISENREFYNRTKSQMISYWDCYYRKEYPNPKSYIGFQIYSDLEKAYNKRINNLNG